MNTEQLIVGYMPVGKEYVLFVADNFKIKVISPDPNPKEANRILRSFIEKHNHPKTFISGEASTGHLVSFLLLENLQYVPYEIVFATPLILKSYGNNNVEESFTCGWENFHAIKFYGGNINTIYNPKNAAMEMTDFYNDEVFSGAQKINIRPFQDYTHNLLVSMDDRINAKMTLSTFSSDCENKDQREIGFLDSFIRFSFQEPQSFGLIPKLFQIISKLISLCTGQKNIRFHTSIQQRKNNEFFNTANCLFNFGYDNYSEEFNINVISLDNFLENEHKKEIFISLIKCIANHKADHIIQLLSFDNRRRRFITINDLTSLISALEIEYNAANIDNPKDDLIKCLKKEIKETINHFMDKHSDIDINQETNIRNAFQHLDFTLKEKIFTLYREQRTIMDDFLKKRYFPEMNRENIGRLITIRNNALHSGFIEWNGSENLYVPLKALVYASFLKRIGCSDEMTKKMIQSLF